MQELKSLSAAQNGVSSRYTVDNASSSADADFFKALLSPTATSTSRINDPQASTLLSIASVQLTESTDRMARSLKAISKKGNEEALGNFPNQLSNSLFLSQILVKSLGKTTQCIDKICNLQ